MVVLSYWLNTHHPVDTTLDTSPCIPKVPEALAESESVESHSLHHSRFAFLHAPSEPAARRFGIVGWSRRVRLAGDRVRKAQVSKFSYAMVPDGSACLVFGFAQSTVLPVQGGLAS